jgi:hypothetical protein
VDFILKCLLFIYIGVGSIAPNGGGIWQYETEEWFINWIQGYVEIIYKNPFRPSQETHYVSATKPNRLMLFRETVAVCCENRMEHVGRIRSLWLLKQLVYIVTTVLQVMKSVQFRSCCRCGCGKRQNWDLFPGGACSPPPAPSCSHYSNTCSTHF